ncbi:small RNA 2'-O-methyltransferase isoform X2 [Clupea harengus]|uniref:Small RNA 2'-O-methyltransferase n=1 Tax=Clupea harengus TaxID=7950 RepID=A0A6P8G7G2_CLUHA|nr:small RNA 2'-O-methyltransferase isoform X2 [Clupea harengus]
MANRNWLCVLYFLPHYSCSGISLLLTLCKSTNPKRHSFAPLSSDYLQPRSGPLTIELYQGSVTQPDPSTHCFDLVTCIELIEHLHLEEVERFTEVLFGFMAPSNVIVSTPNADYNPLLPGLVGFRHHDHKFEWSRKEFQLWALRLCDLFGYIVSFTGVGSPADSHTNVGFCSQIAVFNRDPSRQDSALQCRSREEPTVYRLLYSVVYPSLSDNNILQRTLVNEVLCRAELIKRSWLSGEWVAKTAPEPFMQGSSVCVSLLDVWACPRVRSLCGTLRRFTEALMGELRVELTPARQAIIMPADEEEEEEVEEDEDAEAAGTKWTATTATEDWDAEMPHNSNSNLPDFHDA